MLLRNVRLIDGVSKEPREAVSILVRNGKFEAIGQEVLSTTEGEEVIDLTGMTLLPGLFDCHAHLGWDNVHDIQLQSQQDTPGLASMKAIKNAEAFLAAGVVAIRDLGVHWIGVEARNALAQGVSKGPVVFASGPPITITGGHCWWCGIEADGVEGVRRTVRFLAKRGVDLIKVIATGASLGSFLFPATSSTPRPTFTFEELIALVDEAHNLGRKVAAHATTPQGAEWAIRAGVDSIEHGTDFDERLIELMLERGTFLVPTFSAAWQQAHHGHEIGIPEAQIERRKKMIADPATWAGNRRAVQAGVSIAVGTDQGSPCVPPSSLVTEMWLYLHYGLTENPMDVIKAATINAARLVGVDAYMGSVEPGKRADFIVVAGDPLRDLRNLERPAMVFQEGRLVARGGALLQGSACPGESL